MNWKIVADSGSNLLTIENLAPNTTFERVPLTIQTAGQLFVDDANLNIDAMMTTMYNSQSAATSACPSPEAYMSAFEGAENIIVITITGGLSGSYNSALLAKNIYLENNNANIHVINSLSAGGEMDLLALKVNELIAEGKSFDDVVSEMTAYQEKSKLLFVLAKVDNLVKSGRLNKLVATVVGMLNIRMVGRASTEGTLELLHKARGEKKAVQAVINEMLAAGYAGGRVIISHRNNPMICEAIRTKIVEQFPTAEIIAIPTSGLCSFYAEEEGILMGYETN